MKIQVVFTALVSLVAAHVAQVVPAAQRRLGTGGGGLFGGKKKFKILKCKDDKDFSVWRDSAGGKEIDCKYIDKKKSRRENYCQQTDFQRNCPKTCDMCGKKGSKICKKNLKKIACNKLAPICAHGIPKEEKKKIKKKGGVKNYRCYSKIGEKRAFKKSKDDDKLTELPSVLPSASPSAAPSCSPTNDTGSPTKSNSKGSIKSPTKSKSKGSDKSTEKTKTNESDKSTTKTKGAEDQQKKKNKKNKNKTKGCGERRGDKKKKKNNKKKNKEKNSTKGTEKSSD